MYDALRPGIVEESPKRVDFVGGRTTRSAWQALERLPAETEVQAGIAQWPRNFGARPPKFFNSGEVILKVLLPSSFDIQS